jgi:hypothetical protein
MYDTYLAFESRHSDIRISDIAPDIILRTRYRDYHIQISGPAVLCPILYPISKLAYPDIGTPGPDVVSNIVPDIGDGMSDIGVLIPDIGAP